MAKEISLQDRPTMRKDLFIEELYPSNSLSGISKNEKKRFF